MGTANRLIAVTAWLLVFCACDGKKVDQPGDPDDPAGPQVGQTDFISADARAGETLEATNSADGAGALGAGASVQESAASGADTDSSAMRSGDATVEEGDIYRVLDKGTILNLNRYRGVQVIDVSDPGAPEIIGGYSVQGEPVELYVRGDTALVLLNNWSGYYGSRDDVNVEQREGGLLLSIDLSDPADPALNGSVFVRGHIHTSRVVSDDQTASLYVASSAGEEVQTDHGWDWISRTIVTSFDVSGDALKRRTELDLGGYVQDIQATPNALLVASNDWDRGDDRNDVAIVDISNPDGTMVLGDSVRVAGYVQSQFNMDLHEGVLRVVSTSWEREATNVVETFDAQDISKVTPIDSCSFGADQELYATLFLGEKAFFVTYLRQDPFHAFEIGADGSCEEKNEFIVSGWNDFFRPVADKTRLIGIGQDDAGGGQSPAVSLYDITDLSNQNPLLARGRAAELEWSWSEANWDHRAFSVLEDAVSVVNGEGVEETGLVLLPFSGWSEDSDNGRGGHQSGVQLFTFSQTTVTARAAMEHPSDVRRTFVVSDDVAASLSEQSLSLFDHTDPNAPEELGSVELAPDYGRVLTYGDYLARLKRPAGDHYYYDFEEGATAADADVPTSMIEIIERAADPNTTDVVASVEVPFDSRLLKAGDALVAISYRGRECDDWPCSYDTKVRLFDLSDPTDPKPAGTAETDDVSPSYVGFGGDYYFGGGEFIGCGVGAYWFSGNQIDGTFALGDSVVFTVAHENEELLGSERVCEAWTESGGDCLFTPDGPDGCDTPVYQGNRSCRTLKDGPEVCEGGFYLCNYEQDESHCDPVDIDDVPDLHTECWTDDRYRRWTSYGFKALDISDLNQPRFGELVDMPKAEEGVRVLPADDSIYYTYKRPLEAEDDARPHVRYFFKQLDFEHGRVSVGGAVNIPGELIAVDDDRLYTRDIRWVGDEAESYLHELSHEGASARLLASLRFEDRQVRKVVTDDGRLLVSHSPTEQRFGRYDGPVVTRPGGGGPAVERQLDKLTILSRQGLEVLGEADVDRWASLEAANEGKVLYEVSGGMLLLNVQEPDKPFAQAYFATYGWPEQILFDDGEITMTAGRYGIHRFAADEFNLLSE